MSIRKHSTDRANNIEINILLMSERRELTYLVLVKARKESFGSKDPLEESISTLVDTQEEG